jgi:DNA-binding HxlR family transcriptional regulator
MDDGVDGTDEIDGETWRGLHDALSGKWTFHVLGAIGGEAVGFNELRRRLDGVDGGGSAARRTRSGGVTAKTLSTRLRDLRRLGVVEREVIPASPPTTAYSLTPRGRAFVSLLSEMASMVDVVPCDPCEDACEVATVDERATTAALREQC